MIDTKQAIATAPRSQYYGRSVPLHMTISYHVGRALERMARMFDAERRWMVRRTMKEMWVVGSRVSTAHGNGVVIKNTLLLNTFSMGGYIQTDVRYDSAPADAPNEYPHVGHYNQIFVEAEL
jgi:hypothetical protein